MIRLATLSLLALTLPAAAQVAGAQVAGTNGSFTERFSAHAPLTQRSGPTLKPAVTIVGEIVRIGDLVENAGAAANVADLPRARPRRDRPRRGRSRHRGGAAARDRQLDTRGLTDVVVTRASTTITAKDIESAHHAGARRPPAQHRRGQPDADLRQRTPRHPHRAGHRAAHGADGVRSAQRPLRRRCSNAPAARNLLRYTGTYAETFEAAVLARPLAIGEVVRAADVIIVRRPKTEFAANIITTAEQAIGLAARRAMRPGDVLRQTDLAKARNGRPQRQRHHHLSGARHHAHHARQGARRRRAWRHHQRAQRAVQAADPGNDRRARPCRRGRDHAGERHAGDDGTAPRRPDHRPFQSPTPQPAPAPSERHDS